MPPRKRVVSQEDMLAQLAAGIKKQARTPNIYGYVPHDKQRQFHSSRAKIRQYIGGNRSGKTTAAVAECIFYLKGEHPYKPVWEPPVFGRTIGVDFVRGVKGILIPQFERWMPPSLLKGGSWTRSFDSESRTLSLTNGSTLEFMSYEQDTDKFAGVPRHFTHFDEEPPKHIYNECKARLIDYNGDHWFSMTPVEGMTWVYEEIFEKGSQTDPNAHIFVVIADMTDNPYISQDGIDNFLRDLDEDEIKRRESGQFVSLGGLVFKKFKPETHVVSQYIPPRSWQWYASVDHGINNPTAWLWHAVSPDDRVVTFWEEVHSDMIISQWAVKFHQTCEMLKVDPDKLIIVGDPAGKQRNQVTGTSVHTEYAKHGIYIGDGNNDVEVGVLKMQDYLYRTHPDQVPYWTITDNCPVLIKQMRKLRWATWAGRKAQYENNKQEKIHKKDDHAPDSARYMFSFLPDLMPIEEEIQVRKPLESSPLIRYDEALVASAGNSTAWTVHQGTDLYSLEYD